MICKKNLVDLCCLFNILLEHLIKHCVLIDIVRIFFHRFLVKHGVIE